MAFELFRRKQTNDGVILFRGTLPPRLEELGLGRLAIDASPREVPNTHWAANLRHAKWGKALLLAPRKSMVPPAVSFDWDPWLGKSDKALARQAGAALHASWPVSLESDS
jgi:hypothetical protein